MRVLNRRAWWICSSALLVACLEPNPNAVGTDEASTSDTGTDGGGTADATTDTTETTGALACPAIVDPDECAATDGCQPVSGSKLKENGPDSPCLEPAEFLGCIPVPEQGCDDAPTWFCQGNGSYQVADSCGPEGFTACDGPADPVDACP